MRGAHLYENGRLDHMDAELANRAKYDSMPIASNLIRTIEEDSDDQLDNFNSSQWG